MDAFKVVQRENEVEQTNEMLDRCVLIMQNGKFSRAMAAAAILRSQERSKQPADPHETLFYRVCKWLYNYREGCIEREFKQYNNTAQLVAAIVNGAVDGPPLSTTGVRSCLASYPFDIPERLRPVKYKKAEKSTSRCAPPPRSAEPAAPALRSLTETAELHARITIGNDTRALELFEGLFAAELAEIKRRLS